MILRCKQKLQNGHSKLSMSLKKKNVYEGNTICEVFGKGRFRVQGGLLKMRII